MLIRISLIIAILAALGAGVVNFVVVKDKIGALTTDRNTQRDGWHETSRQLDQTNTVLVKTQGTLKQTQQELAVTQSDLAKSVANVAVQTKRADDLNDKLTKASQERDAAQNDLAAYVATGIKPEDIGKLKSSLKDAQAAIVVANEEKMVLTRTITRLTNQLAKVTGTQDYIVKLPADLKGKIVVVDPKWDFVVLNIGEDQGVLQDGEMLVNRDGKLVAKVIIRSIEKGRCIANIVPGWKLGEVIEGDDVIPANPAS